MVNVNCEQCKKTFKVFPYKVRRAKRLFCDIECKKLYDEANRKYNCTWCGKEAIKTRTQMKNKNRKNWFCSKDCLNEWADSRYHGFDRMRKKARKRDNYTCQHCGSVQDLQVHHVKRAEDYKSTEEANNLSNLITLCRSCHVFAHPDRPLPPSGYKGGKVTLICKGCGKEFKVFPYRVKAGRKFCTTSCKNEYYKKPVKANCTQCGKEFNKSEKQKSSKNKNAFCSRICFHKWRKGKYFGKITVMVS